MKTDLKDIKQGTSDVKSTNIDAAPSNNLPQQSQTEGLENSQGVQKGDPTLKDQDSDNSQNAEKVAKGAIMARNMSHNLGSHVLSYMQSLLISKAENKQQDSLSEKEVRGIAHLMQYLQERQDFIATVATYEVPYFSPVPFKEAIFDFLNPDYISKRHSNTPEITNYILDNIARSEGYTRDGIHKLNICYYDGNEVLYGKNKPEELDPLRDFMLFLPGGTVGRQAIMSIVENVIRNAAKHEKHSENLTIYLQLLAAKELETHLAKNSSLESERLEAYKEAIDKDVLCYLLVSYPATDFGKSLEILKKGLDADYVDKYNASVAQSYKGIKEIRISASWLRGIINEEKYKNQKLSPLVSVHQSIVKDQDVLQYIVGIRKSRKLAIVKEGYEESFLSVFSKRDDWHVRFYENAEDYNNDSFSNCAEYTIVLSSEILGQIQEKACNRVVELDPKRLTEGEKALIDSFPRNLSENYLKIIVSRFAGEEISIVDKKICIQYPGLQIPFKEGIAKLANEIDYQYVYKRHLDENNAWDGILKQLSDPNGDFRNIKFLESITGSNSTTRIVAQKTLDEYWYYEQIYSMKTQIALIDERFYKKDILDANNGKKAILHKLTGVYLFNIDIDSCKNNECDIWGFVPQGNYNEKQCVIIGKLCLDFASKSVSINIDQDYKARYPDCFNYISIHQGLLDKIYGKLRLVAKYKKIKEVLNVTNMIVEGFNRDMSHSRLTIHSGRGKTEISKMPQLVPFIQFSSLSEALNDCKYSLVSLLSYAKYVPTK